MATLNCSAAFRLKDINNDITSLVVYFQSDDANTLAALATDMQTFMVTLDAVTDAVIIQSQISFISPLGPGIKTTARPQPIASGELATYKLTDPDVRQFGVTTPALSRTFIDASGNVITTGLNGTYLGYWLVPFGVLGLTLLTNLWGTLQRLDKLGINTRKHRRQQQKVNLKVEP
jgi:hypothetical protein